MNIRSYSKSIHNRQKVLIIDDEQENIELYTLFLQAEFDIDSAQTGEEGYRKILEFEPDVVLLDIMLPDISGYDICKKIRNNEEFKLMKVLFVSGKVDIEDRLLGYSIGADDYVTKPVNPDELLAKVKVYSKLRKIEEIDRYKNNFMSLINHETSTPLNAIIGFSRLLLDHKDDQVVGFAKEIAQAGDRLNEKIGRILTLNDIYNDSAQYEEEVVDIENIINDVVARYSEGAKAKNIEIKNNIPDGHSLLVSSNEGLLFKSIDYVFKNAVEFTVQGGTVIISAREEAERVVMTILDEGPGFTEEQLKSIFDFFNCNDLLHHKTGLSISIAIANSCMSKYGGSLVVTNGKEKGARLEFTFMKFNIE